MRTYIWKGVGMKEDSIRECPFFRVSKEISLNDIIV